MPLTSWQKPQIMHSQSECLIGLLKPLRLQLYYRLKQWELLNHPE